MDSSRKTYYIPPFGLAHSYGRSGENGISSRDEYNPSPPTGYRRDNGFEGASASPYENMTTTFEPDPSYQDRESWNRYSFLAENDPRTQRTESQYPSHSFYNHRSSDTIAYTASSAIPRTTNHHHSPTLRDIHLITPSSGAESMRAKLDTGADCSCISYDKALQSRLPIHPYNGNGAYSATKSHVITPVGMIFASFHFIGHTERYEETFLVIEDSIFDVILSGDFLIKHRLVSFNKEHKDIHLLPLVFKDKESKEQKTERERARKQKQADDDEYIRRRRERFAEQSEAERQTKGKSRLATDSGYSVGSGSRDIYADLYAGRRR